MHSNLKILLDITATKLSVLLPLTILITTTTYPYLCQERTDGELVHYTTVADAAIKAETLT